MALQLVLDANGNYTYQDPRTVKPRPMISNEFEAYESKQQTKLAGDTNIGEQTEKIIRETPGQYTTSFNEQTGQFETKTQGGEITNIPFQAPTGVTPSAPTETALDKVSKITAATKPGSANTDRIYKLIENQQKLNQRAQQFNQITQTLDMGLKAYNLFTGKGAGFGTPPINPAGSTPLTSLAKMPVGQSSLGGIGAAGSIAYGVGTVFKVKPKERTGMTAGASIGMAVGGPAGAVAGAVIGGVLGCFLPNTEITMADGSKKKIIDIELKDNIKVGGNVFATAKFLITNLYDYKGVKVSGSHMVNENGKWIRVEDSNIAKSLGNDEHVVYTLGTQNRRIVINDILFTDYFEIDEKEELVKQGDSYFDTWKLHSDYLSQQNVYKINEKQTLELR